MRKLIAFFIAAAALAGCVTVGKQKPETKEPPRFETCIAASVGGNTAPDGTEIQIDFPSDRIKKNSTSLLQGCCVWTSISMAADWQNVPAYLNAPDWIRSKAIPGGASPDKVDKYLQQMAKDRGYKTAPKYMNYEGSDRSMVKLACQTGRMACCTYYYSPTGRYNGKPIEHMVNVLHASDKWFAIMDSNFPSGGQLEWLTPDEFQSTWTDKGTRAGWLIVLLDPPPPPPPTN